MPQRRRLDPQESSEREQKRKRMGEKSVKHGQGTAQEKCSVKPLIGKKEKASIMPGFRHSKVQSLKFQRSGVPG